MPKGVAYHVDEDPPEWIEECMQCPFDECVDCPIPSVCISLRHVNSRVYAGRKIHIDVQFRRKAQNDGNCVWRSNFFCFVRD